MAYFLIYLWTMIPAIAELVLQLAGYAILAWFIVAAAAIVIWCCNPRNPITMQVEPTIINNPDGSITKVPPESIPVPKWSITATKWLLPIALVSFMIGKLIPTQENLAWIIGGGFLYHNVLENEHFQKEVLGAYNGIKKAVTPSDSANKDKGQSNDPQGQSNQPTVDSEQAVNGKLTSLIDSIDPQTVEALMQATTQTLNNVNENGGLQKLMEKTVETQQKL